MKRLFAGSLIRAKNFAAVVLAPGRRSERVTLAGIRGEFRNGTYLVSKHGLDRVLQAGLDLEDIAGAVHSDAPVIIENYPKDKRGPSCLILCQGASGRWYHLVSSYPPGVRIITTYEPDPGRWMPDLRRRR